MRGLAFVLACCGMCVVAGCPSPGWHAKVQALDYIPEPLPVAVASPSDSLGSIYRIERQGNTFSRSPVIRGTRAELALPSGLLNWSFREVGTLALDVSVFGIAIVEGPDKQPVESPHPAPDVLTLVGGSLQPNQTVSLRAARFVDGTVSCLQPSIAEAEVFEKLSAAERRALLRQAESGDANLAFVSRILYARELVMKSGGGLAFQVNANAPGTGAFVAKVVGGSSDSMEGRFPSESTGGYVCGYQLSPFAIDSWFEPDGPAMVEATEPEPRDAAQWTLLGTISEADDTGVLKARVYAGRAPLELPKLRQ